MNELEELKNRCSELEQKFKNITIYFCAVGAAIVIVFGTGWLDIARKVNKIWEESVFKGLVKRAEKAAEKAEEHQGTGLRMAKSAEKHEAIAKQKATNIEKIESKKINKLSKQFMDIEKIRSNISPGKGCASIEKLQICWGKATIIADPNPKRKHTTTFEFIFAKPFSEKPTITNGINVNGEGDSLSVYQWEVTTHDYKGRLSNLFRDSPPISDKSTMTMQYMAIGLIN